MITTCFGLLGFPGNSSHVDDGLSSIFMIAGLYGDLCRGNLVASVKVLINDPCPLGMREIWTAAQTYSLEPQQSCFRNWVHPCVLKFTVTFRQTNMEPETGSFIDYYPP